MTPTRNETLASREAGGAEGVAPDTGISGITWQRDVSTAACHVSTELPSRQLRLLLIFLVVEVKSCAR